MNKDRIRLAESQLRQIIKESVDSILKESSKKKGPMSQWLNDFNKATKTRETMGYATKGKRNPLSENKNENLNNRDVRFIPLLKQDIYTLDSLLERWQYTKYKPKGIDAFIDAVINAKVMLEDMVYSLEDHEY